MAHIRDRGKTHSRRWQARYRDPADREKSKTFERKADAQRWLDEITADLVIGRYVDPRAGKVTLEKFAHKWLQSQTFDESTRETVESRLRVHILPELGNIELRHLRPSTIQSWLRGRQKECAPSYVRVLLANLSSVLGAALDDGLIAANPCQSPSVKAPKIEQRRVVPWTHEQVHAVIS